MPYLVATLIAWGLFVSLVDRRRLREYYPTFLFVIVLGHVGDRIFVYFLRLYEYTDPILSGHLVTLLIHTLFFPPLAILYVQYARRFNVWG